jgi:hypothetical protein
MSEYDSAEAAAARVAKFEAWAKEQRANKEQQAKNGRAMMSTQDVRVWAVLIGFVLLVIGSWAEYGPWVCCIVAGATLVGATVLINSAEKIGRHNP